MTPPADYSEHSTQAEVLLKRARVAAQDRRYAEAQTAALAAADSMIKMSRALGRQAMSSYSGLQTTGRERP